ncbi:MAG TPA: GGDEF and EAL domain-containing protein [Stellaceae bacterium]|nr:GGDEF and EAL domain-containing protein [Stellaceae bacterium]
MTKTSSSTANAPGVEVNTELKDVLAALASAGDVAYVWDIDSDIITWHGSLQMLGFDEGMKLATGQAFAERINPDDLLQRQQQLHAHYARGLAFDCEYRVRLQGGSFGWLHDRGTAELDHVGRPKSLRGVVRLVTTRKTQEQRLELLANYDDLTGHFNKKRLREVLDHQLAASFRAGASGAYLAIGIDKLATINDAFGYDAADQVLIEIGRRLDRCLRVSDVVGRVGGDRFGVILAHCVESHVSVAAEKILATVGRSPIETAAGPIYATVSIGSTIFPEQAKTAYEVMTRAESALSEAKRAGRDCFVPYRLSEEQRHRHRVGMALGEQVQRALKENRLPLAYQPVVSSVTGEVDYYECLLRMIGEDGRIVAAGAFVAAIEQMGFIRVIDRYVLETAVEQIESHSGFCLGINISGLTATDRAWLRAVTAMLKDKPSIANRVLVEITETAALHDLEESARFVASLRDLGCRVALDDFGAGFTSLRHLQALAVDTVKIDGSFVRNLTQSEDNQIFLRHLVGLANTLGLQTVAEMVETAEEAAILQREGVAFLQGYYFGKPSLDKPWIKPPALVRPPEFVPPPKIANSKG